MVEFLIFLCGNISGILLLYFFVLRPEKKTEEIFDQLQEVNTKFTDALAHEALERQRKRVRDNNLGTPEELGFDTPTERL